MAYADFAVIWFLYSCSVPFILRPPELNSWQYCLYFRTERDHQRATWMAVQQWRLYLQSEATQWKSHCQDIVAVFGPLAGLEMPLSRQHRLFHHDPWLRNKLLAQGLLHEIRSLRGIVTLFLFTWKIKNMSSHQWTPTNNGLVLLRKTVLLHWNYFLSSVATDGTDGNGKK